jgi:hypothetical protein
MRDHKEISSEIHELVSENSDVFRKYAILCDELLSHEDSRGVSLFFITPDSKYSSLIISKGISSKTLS